MHMRRKILMGVLALALPATSVAILQAPALAKTPKPPPFVGAATGVVSCAGVAVKISFVPPLTLSTGGSTINVKGSVTGCTVTGSTDTITKGKITGSFSGAGTGVNGLLGGITTPVHLSIVWKGKHGLAKATFTPSTVTLAGAAPAFDPNVGFELPNPAAPGPNTVTGSFAGTVVDHSFVYSALAPLVVAGLAAGKHGLKKLVATHGVIKLP
jgi:hypothetical protein